MTGQETIDILKLIVDAYPASAPRASEGVVRIWQKSFAKFDFEDVEAAVERHIINNKFAPTIYEIMAVIREKESEQQKITAEITNQYDFMLSYWGAEHSEELGKAFYKAIGGEQETDRAEMAKKAAEIRSASQDYANEIRTNAEGDFSNLKPLIEWIKENYLTEGMKGNDKDGTGGHRNASCE